MKIISYEVFEKVLCVEVEVVLSDGNHLAIEVHLAIESGDGDEPFIYPTRFGGCLGVEASMPLSLDHCRDDDSMGNSLDLLKNLNKDGLIKLRLAPDYNVLAEWNFHGAFNPHFYVHPGFIPDRVAMKALIRNLIELALPDDLLGE